MVYLILIWLISDALSVAILAFTDWDLFLWEIRRIWGDRPNEVSHSTVPMWLTLLISGPIGAFMLTVRVLIPTLLSR